MRSLKTFQGILWLLYQFLFLLDEVKGGAKRDFFDCATVHICECGLAEEYNKCYLLAPDEVKENAIALYAEYFPGEYTLDEGMKPCILELCKNKGDDTREVQNNPLKAKEKNANALRKGLCDTINSKVCGIRK